MAFFLFIGCSVKTQEKRDRVLSDFKIDSQFIIDSDYDFQGDSIRFHDIAEKEFFEIIEKSSIFEKFYVPRPGMVIEWSGGKVRFEEADKYLYSVGNPADGTIKVILFDQKSGDLYLIYSIGIM